MKRTLTTATVFAAFAMLATGCPGHLADPGVFVGPLDAGATTCLTPIENVPSDILGTRCATSGCHDSATHQQMLDLASPGLASRLVGVASTECPGQTLVVPGATPSGFFLDKLGDSPTCGARMPSGLPPLTREEMVCVRAWVGSLTNAPTDGGVQDVTDVQAMDVQPDVAMDVATDTGMDAGDDTGTDVPPTDTGSPDTGSPDTGPRDTGVRDTGAADTSQPDVAMTDAATDAE